MSWDPKMSVPSTLSTGLTNPLATGNSTTRDWFVAGPRYGDADVRCMFSPSVPQGTIGDGDAEGEADGVGGRHLTSTKASA